MKRTNEETRELLEQMIVVERRMTAAILKDPDAVRWTTEIWDKGYPLSMFSDIVVYDTEDQIVYRGTIETYTTNRGV